MKPYKITVTTAETRRNNEVIDHPNYYALPCGKDLEDFISDRQLDFATGSALKYYWRAGKKHGESFDKDLRKCRHYCASIARADGLPKPDSEEAVLAEYVFIRNLSYEARRWDGGAE